MQIPQILIVEDELVTRNTLKSIFEAEGYTLNDVLLAVYTTQIYKSSGSWITVAPYKIKVIFPEEL